jgi:quinol-cytochrome oxidoreductase complex cytochrome b subunit
MSLTVKWRGKPVFIRNRTEEEMAEAQAVAVADLKDPAARNANVPTVRRRGTSTYAYTFGGILMVMLVVADHHRHRACHALRADTAMAFQSVEHIMRDVNYGWLLRYMHANGASFFFVAVYLHIFRGLYYGSYKAPREVLWILGVVICLLMMATAFMGYVLPWGSDVLLGRDRDHQLLLGVPGCR